MRAHERRLFTEMGEGTGDHDIRSCPTVPPLTFKAVYLACPGTEAALGEDPSQCLDPLG
jgi:hypothetical protein